ncbi:MAG: alanine dehydrogenase [Bacteroidetes bacterium]|nr:MAG: alanine dehydrogenase [Bacteroidota bacterium]TAG95080.1 MAG: alanine dehydrogenase [Bacteroidota bacterium]
MAQQTNEEPQISIDPLLKEQINIYPLEEKAPVLNQFQSLSIGIPKEHSIFEKRIPLRPESVALLTRLGHQILIETQAGEASQFSDKEFSEAGAKISYSPEEVFASDLVLKVEPPTLKEIEYMKPNKALISALKTATLSAEYLKALQKKKITAAAYELIEDKVGGIPVMRAMSEIAGSTVMLIAAEYLSTQHAGRGIILGGVTGVPPTRVVIIGAGTVGEYAARTASGLGAEVKVFDQHIYKLRRLKYAIGHEIYTSTFDEFSLPEAIKRADVVIGAVRGEKGRSPIIITEEMVSQMKAGAIIIDVSIDQGGCIETSELTTLQDPIFRKYDVVHYCVPNIASRVAQTSSTALSNIFTPFLRGIGICGGFDEMIFQNQWFLRGIYAYKGHITNHHIAHKFGITGKDLNLLKW